MTHGASMRSQRNAARKVSVRQRPCGTLATSRRPRSERPWRRVMLVLAQVSSMNTRRRGSSVLAETRPDSRCWLFDPCGTCHPFSSSHQFLLCERERVKKGLHRGLAEAPAALVRPLLVVVDEPGIEIGLQFLDRAIDLFTERHPIEL